MSATYDHVRAFLAARRAVAENERRLREGAGPDGVAEVLRRRAEDERKRRRRRVPRGRDEGHEPDFFDYFGTMIPSIPFGGDGSSRGQAGGDAGEGVPISSGSATDGHANQLIEPYWTQLEGEWDESTILTHVSGARGILLYNAKQDGTTGRAGVRLNATATGAEAAGFRLSYTGGLLSGYVIVAELGSTKLYRYDLNVPTLLRTYAVGMGAGDLMEVSCVGTQIRGRFNALNQALSTDATYSTGFAAVLSLTPGTTYRGSTVTI